MYCGNGAARVDARRIAHRHHMNIVLDMGDRDSELGQLLLTQITTSGPVTERLTVE